MLAIAVLSCALLADNPAGKPSGTDRAIYEAAKGRAGRSSDAHVKLALWCEAHGMTAERAQHLVMAVVLDPAHTVARGLLGHVADGARWRRPEDLADRLRDDPARAALMEEYASRRDKAATTADGQWSLALWCESKGLTDEARAHLTATVRLDPSREAAWKRLGCKKVGGRWLTDGQVAAIKAEATAQKAASAAWIARLRKVRNDLADRDRKERAEADLAAVNDPRAVGAVLAVFGRDPRDAGRLVQLLGQIDSPPASRLLAALAIGASDPNVGRAATETLRRRDPREYTEALIALLRDPAKYEVRPVGGPGSPGVLFVEGERFNLRRFYSPPAAPALTVGINQRFGYDEFGLPAVFETLSPSTFQAATGRITGDKVVGVAREMEQRERINNLARANDALRGVSPSTRQSIVGAFDAAMASTSILPALEADVAATAAREHLDPTQFGFAVGRVERTTATFHVGQMQLEAMRIAATAERQLEEDVRLVEASNAAIRSDNAKVLAILSQAVGIDLPDRKAWTNWYVDQLGYRSPTSVQALEKPVVQQEVMIEDGPASPPVTYTVSNTVEYTRMSCFGAGTPVMTSLGRKPIESLRPGDRVLSQDPETGRLDYRAVLVVHRNPPAPTIKVALGDDAIIASTFHRFWVAGRGWVMARDLKVGDPIRTLEGPERVASVEPDRVQPVFNLDVAENKTFFVGRKTALVHDNSVPDFRTKPFDAPADLGTKGPSRD